jgi:hypothetical protein
MVPRGVMSNVIARSEATKQSILSLCCKMDCFASLAMTISTRFVSWLFEIDVGVHANTLVMAGLVVPAIHVFPDCKRSKTCMPGTRLGMTKKRNSHQTA